MNALLTLLENAGYARFEPPVLIPADLVRAVSGEDLNAKLFLTTDTTGQELCLRHDYTLPLTLHMLQSGLTQASFSYSGSVFRNPVGEYTHIGIESFGREDKEAADVEILSLALKGANGALKLNDISLILALIESLNLSVAHKRAVIKAFRRGKPIEINQQQSSYAGVLNALEGADPKAAKALVGDLLSIAGISQSGGRSVNEIAERFLEQASLQNTPELNDKLALLNKVLAIKGKPQEAFTAFNKLVPSINLASYSKLAGFDAEVNFAFAREPDYYDGLVFEITKDDKRLVGGGRYDRMVEMLSTKLGVTKKIPAVGCAFLTGGAL
jgi:ATP phosphoribosyltransferase regulatory subunit